MQIIPRTHDKTMPHDALMRLVEAGDWDAKAIYGARLIGGEGVEQDEVLGIAMMEEARKAGSARGSAGLGIHYAFEKDTLDKAGEYAAEAIERGNPYGWMARVHIGQTSGDDAASAAAGKAFLAESDPKEQSPDLIYSIASLVQYAETAEASVPYYEAAIKGGSRPAAINFALMIIRKQVDLSGARASELLRMAAIDGAPAGATLYANRCLYADDPVDAATLEEALTLLEDVTDPDDHERLHLLAVATDRGRGRAQDDAEATRLYALAAENERDVRSEGPTVLGLGRANIDYALRLSEGKGTDPDPAKALECCERAVALAKEGDVPEMIASAAFHALEIGKTHGIADVPERFEDALSIGANNGEPEMMAPFGRLMAKKTGTMKSVRFWFVSTLACDDPAGGIEGARAALELGEDAQAYAYAHYAATDLGADLPPDLQNLDPEARAAGSLFMKGKTGAQLYEKLKVAVAKAVRKYGDRDEDS